MINEKRLDDVRITLLQRQDGTQFFRVELFSRVKPRCISQGSVECDQKKIENKIAIMGGALAEHQIKMYGDIHDPDSCAKLAVDTYKDLMSDLDESKIGGLDNLSDFGH